MSHLFTFVEDGYEADDDDIVGVDDSYDSFDDAVVSSSSSPTAASLVEPRTPTPCRQQEQSPHGHHLSPWDMLPDNVLIDVGMEVAALCGPKSFVTLAQTCRRMHGLLMSQQEAVSTAIELRLIRFVDNPPTTSFRHAAVASTTVVATSLWAVACRIETLEQLALFEELYGWGLLGPRRNQLFVAPLERAAAVGHDRAAWYSGAMSEGGTFQISVIREILKGYPSVSVHCDVHCSPLWSEDNAMLATVLYGEIFLEDLAGKKFADRVSYSPWGKRVSESLREYTSQEKDDEDKVDKVLVEFYFRMPSRGGGSVDFPRRRSCFKGILPGGYA